MLLIGMEDQCDQTSALQKHVMFFDRNNDGVIYPSETFQGCRAIGVGLLLSSVAAVFVNFSLSRKTRPGKSFSFQFPIEVKNIKLAKHTSDTDIYDNQGRFVPERFELVFSKHALTHPHAWTSQELQTMLKSNREPRDYVAWVAAYLEWKILYSLCKDEQGLLQKQTIKAFYDGTLFYKLAEEQEHASKKKNTTSAV